MRETQAKNRDATLVDHEPRVLLIGERFLLLDALRLALAAKQVDVAVVGTQRDGVAEAAKAFSPELIVFDGSGSSVASIARSIRSLKESNATLVGIAAESVSVEAAQMMHAGADRVLGLDTGFEDLASAINQALSGQSAMPLDRRYVLEELLREHRTREHQRWVRFGELTAQERVIFAMVYEGMSADQIAEDACLSVSTVRSHIRGILKKLNVNSQLSAVAMARTQDWFSSEPLTLVG